MGDKNPIGKEALITLKRHQKYYSLGGRSLCTSKEVPYFVYNNTQYFVTKYNCCECGWSEWDIWNITETVPKKVKIFGLGD